MKHALSRITAATVAVLFTVGVSGVAFASDDRGKLSIVGSTSQSNFRSPVVTPHFGGSGGITPQVTGSGGQIVGSHSVVILPPGGASGTLTQGFNSSYTWGSGIWNSWINVGTVSSHAYWLGATPYYADAIGLTDRVWVSGVGITISAPLSVGASIANNTYTLSTSNAHEWRNEHTISNINFSSLILPPTGPYENSSDTATFGYATFADNNN